MNYDFGNFHPDCKSKQLGMFPDGPHIVCLDCGVSANIEAIADKVSPADIVKVGKVPRKALGDTSPNVAKGAYKE